MFNPTPIIPAPAPEQAAADAVARGAAAMFRQLVQQYQRHYANVWNNKSAAPDKIVAAMGTQAQQIFAASAALGSFLTGLGATVPTAIPAGWNLTENADGSITLAKAAPAAG